MSGVKKGTITSGTATGNQATAGVGFQPVALLLWVTQQTATGYAAGARLSMGFTDGSASACASFASDDAVTPTAPNRQISSTRCVRLLTATGTVAVEASIVSFDADGFTLNWTVANGSAYIVHYLALGSPAVTAAKVGSFVPSGSTGTQAVVGHSFVPGCTFFLGTKDSIANGVSATDAFSMGVMAGASKQGFVARRAAAAATSSEHIAGGFGSHAFQYLGSGFTDAGSFDFSSFDAAGFTVNWGTAGDAATDLVYLSLAGAGFNAGADTQKTSTGTKAKTGVGFQPAGLMIFGPASSAQASDTAAADDSGITVGATDGTSLGVAVAATKNAANPSDTESRTATTKIAAILDVPGSSTTTAEADVTSLDADGYTLNWTTADATARSFLWVAFKQGSAGASGVMLPMGMLGTIRV